MERTISREDRIKRAEELYYRRKNAINMPKTTTVNVNPKKNYKLLKKVIIQILLCMGIYSVIYNLQNKSDNFSIDSINYVKSTIAYDANFNKVLDDVKNYFSSLYKVNEDNRFQENILPEETLSATEETTENIENVEETNVELVSSQGDYRKPYKNNKWGCDDTICSL